MKNNILNTIYWILILFVVLVAIIPAISAFNLKLPFSLYSVETGSMEPVIKPGDLIFVKEEERYQVGDIISFTDQRGGGITTITHRIASINGDGTFMTKGDANSGVDADSVRSEDIVGKYFFRIPLLGYIISFVKTPLGFLILIAIPAIIIAYEEFRKIVKHVSSKKENYQK